jgi:hypothetical protein
MKTKYVPLLKVKQGELEALGYLEQDIKKNTIPLIQFIEDTNLKRSGDYVDTIIRRLTKAWGRNDNILYFDVSNLKSIHLIRIFANQLVNFGRRFIPVVHYNYQDDYLALVKDNYLSNGICLRIKKSFMSPEMVNKFISAIRKNLEIKPENIDLLIDFEQITTEDVKNYQKIFLDLYNSVKAMKLRRIIISAGSFPQKVSEVTQNKIGIIPRPEWELWNSISRKTKDSNLIYSDYGNQHPIYNEETAALERNCCINYTTDKEFIIFRDVNGNKDGNSGENYVKNSKLLIEHPFYEGKNYCWGDGYIFDCANKDVKYNGTPLWVKITLNHHLTKILNLLS